MHRRCTNCASQCGLARQYAPTGNCERKNFPNIAQNYFATCSENNFKYADMFGKSDFGETKFRKLENLSPYLKKVPNPFSSRYPNFITIHPLALSLMAREAMQDISFLLRSSHLQQLQNILNDRESVDNDKFVALELLKNASLAAQRVLPGCQDTGTAIIFGKKGEYCLTTPGINDVENAELLNMLGIDPQSSNFQCTDDVAFSRGVYEAYTQNALRYSQMAPLNMFDEKNTNTNLPAQVDIQAVSGDEYKLMFMAKGGGSANKSFLYQQTRAVLNPTNLLKFLEENIKTIGTSACPPYHLAIVIGGTSAELTLKTVKLASAKFLDYLPTSGTEAGIAYRDLQWEEKVLKLTQDLGIGAQFGGKYFCHDVRVIRLPRHGASCPIGIGVSCSADRQIFAKINEDGFFLEQLETNPHQYLPPISNDDLTSNVINIDLNQPMENVLSILNNCAVKQRLSLTGTLIVARDIAHARLAEMVKNGEELPEYFKRYPIYYAGPAKTPTGHVSGSFGPTTAGRMDSYADTLMTAKGTLVSLAKGNRSKNFVQACKKHGGFYLGSIGGSAAILAKDCIKSVEVLDFPELGMEAVRKIEVENFPAFVVIDNKGNDFFSNWI